MKIAIIIPTYNEAGAIGPLLDDLQAVFAHHPRHAWSVVVVDGNSPDGTADIVRKKDAAYKNINLIIEPGKRGIAMAYVTGMRYAIDTLRAEAFVEFDGDGQHDPRDIPRLIAALEEDNDYVIGSRYVPGGSIPKEWPLYRKLLSRLGSLYARILLELPVYDATSGLKATRVGGAANFLSLREDKLLSRQYAYKLQFLYEMVQASARVQEIPITFRLRENDISKSAWYDIFESLRVTALLRIQTLRQWRFLRVIIVGGIGFLFQATMFEALGIRLHLLRPSTIILTVAGAAILLNFFLHESFSFKDRKELAAPRPYRLARFALLSLGSVCIQWILVYGTEITIGESPMYLRAAYVLGVGLGLMFIYAGSYFWVWGNERHPSTH